MLVIGFYLVIGVFLFCCYIESNIFPSPPSKT